MRTFILNYTDMVIAVSQNGLAVAVASRGPACVSLPSSALTAVIFPKSKRHAPFSAFIKVPALVSTSVVVPASLPALLSGAGTVGGERPSVELNRLKMG